MATNEEPTDDDLAERFPHVAELERQLREADIDLDDLPQREGTTRRELLQAAGVLGGGALLGGVGANELAGTASAGTNQVGTVGTAANPVDVEADDVNAAAVATEEINNIPRVSDASELQDALFSTAKVVKLDGVVDVSTVESGAVSTGADTVLIGNGRVSYDTDNSEPVAHGDVLVHDVADDAALKLGAGSQVVGIGVINQNNSGYGIDARQITRTYQVDVFARERGWYGNVSGGTVEPKVMWSRFTSDGGAGSGSFGIYNDHNDLKCAWNICRGFATGVYTSGADSQIKSVHAYPSPASDYERGFVLDSDACWLIASYADGAPTTAAVVDKKGYKNRVKWNWLNAGSGATGVIYVNQSSSGNLTRCNYSENWLEGADGSATPTGIATNNVSGIYRSVVHPNHLLNVTSQGLEQTEAAGGGGSPTGNQMLPMQIRENSDDNTAWLKLPSETLVQIG